MVEPSDRQAAIGCWLSALGGILASATAISAGWFYYEGDTVKAIFWLLVTVLINRWSDSVLKRATKGPPSQS